MRTIALTEETRKNVLENLLKRSPSSYGKFENAVAEIVENVRNNKDAAVFEYTKRFDGADINAGNIKVTKEEIDEAYEQLIRLFWMLSERHWSTFANITKNRKNTARFEQQTGRNHARTESHAACKVGVYVPGGKAVYPSSVLMNVVPAKWQVWRRSS